MPSLHRACCILAVLTLASESQAQTSRYPTRYQSYRPSYQASGGVTYRRPTTTSHQRRKTPYRLDSGDTVAVIVQGITGEFSKAPVHMPKDGDGTLPAVGQPMVVLRDGTLPMPLIKPVSVRGLTVTQARDKVSRAYLDEEVLSKPNQVTLSLMRKRTISVSVLHDNPSLAMRGISNVTVPADQANVLGALVGSGSFDRDASISVIKSNGQRTSSRSRLSNGDTVHVQSRPAGRFFTGGSLRGGEFGIPSDRPLNAMQAISLAGGLQQTGLQQYLGPREVRIIRQRGGTIRMGYRQLLNNPNAYIMQSGDTLIVR